MSVGEEYQVVKTRREYMAVGNNKTLKKVKREAISSDPFHESII